MHLVAGIGLQDGGTHGAAFPAHLLEGRQGRGGGEKAGLAGGDALGGEKGAGNGGEGSFRKGEGDSAVINGTAAVLEHGGGGGAAVPVFLKDRSAVGKGAAEAGLRENPAG